MRSQILLILIPISFIISSCRNEDLKMARSFSTLSKELRSANETISADIYVSCTRSATWEAVITAASRQNMREQLIICDRLYRPNSQNTKIAGSVLVKYVAAIGDLASNNSNSFTPQLANLSEALANLDINGNKISDNAREAGFQIADFITNLIFKDFRRRNLKLAVICTDQDIQKYSTNLSSFIDSSYVNYSLNREIAQIHEHFGFYIGDVNKRLRKISDRENNLQNLKILQEQQTLLEEKERAEINKVIERKKKGSAYVAAIRFTADFHHKLKYIFNKNQEELSSKQIQKCNKYRSRNQKKISLQKTNQEDESWDLEISNSELKQVKKATNEYIDKITPLFEEIQD
ncbi:hypothetical protein [Mastigocoleus testarum]|uniref:Lipoprotein n=1 Tax=Mastigocoleus testarum BC008 TaxID=371196 RepID=A0A0V7ZX85_9CYAN|nr:hypothetical protein [Mastigocoleus testarum]KST69009.1 hypothetical protein BC008_02785 [Mastigocoleus testarum BC008]